MDYELPPPTISSGSPDKRIARITPTPFGGCMVCVEEDDGQFVGLCTFGSEDEARKWAAAVASKIL